MKAKAGAGQKGSGVPSSRLNRLWGRRAELPAQVQDSLGKLAKLAETQPELAGLATTTAALLRVMYADVPTVPFPFSTEQVTLKWEGGVPLLRGERLPLDTAWLGAQFGRLCHVMEEQRHPSARPLVEAVKRKVWDVAALAQSILSDDAAVAVKRADELGLDAELAATLLRLTLLPLLEQISAAARSLRPREGWTMGYCPTCGAWPLLGEYRGLELTRFLRCGLCADDWGVDRLFCFVCGARAHHDLQYIQVAGEELKQRAQTCERCHSYIKQLSTFSALSAPALLVADIATLHLDLVALERTYSPPS